MAQQQFAYQRRQDQVNPLKVLGLNIESIEERVGGNVATLHQVILDYARMLRRSFHPDVVRDVEVLEDDKALDPTERERRQALFDAKRRFEFAQEFSVELNMSIAKLRSLEDFKEYLKAYKAEQSVDRIKLLLRNVTQLRAISQRLSQHNVTTMLEMLTLPPEVNMLGPLRTQFSYMVKRLPYESAASAKIEQRSGSATSLLERATPPQHMVRSIAHSVDSVGITLAEDGSLILWHCQSPGVYLRQKTDLRLVGVADCVHIYNELKAQNLLNPELDLLPNRSDFRPTVESTLLHLNLLELVGNREVYASVSLGGFDPSAYPRLLLELSPRLTQIGESQILIAARVQHPEDEKRENIRFAILGSLKHSWLDGKKVALKPDQESDPFSLLVRPTAKRITTAKKKRS